MLELTTFQEAVRCKQAGVCKFLIHRGLDPNYANLNGG